MNAASLSSKELFAKTLNLERIASRPVAPHWWGLYKYETLGLDYRRAAWEEGAKLAAVYRGFFEKFRPDWFHLHLGTPRYFRNAQIVDCRGKPTLTIDPAQRSLKKQDRYFSVHSPEDEEIVDFPDYLLASRAARPKASLNSRSSIDDFVKRYIHTTAKEILDLGYADHVKLLVESYGGTIFIAVHIPSAICEIFDPTTGYLGFDQGLAAFHEHPKNMRYLLERCYEEQLEWAKAYAQAGAHAYIISESYVTPDIVGPRVYRDFVKSVHRDYFGAIVQMGVAPICMFWGDVRPVLEDLTEVNLKALLIEESKKGFELRVPEIQRHLAGRLCLFGNLDSLELLHDGRPRDIREEVRAQMAGADTGFVVANGSPITPGTPEVNVAALIAAGREKVGASSPA